MARFLWIALVWIAAANATAHGQLPAGSQRAAALRRVADAQRAVDDAAAALARAERAVDGTEGEARKTSERLVEQAREKLEAARRELGRRNTEVLNAAARDAAAAGRAASGTRPPFSPEQQEREHADPSDPLERFALLTSGGPVVVEVSLTIDGQPFRQARERLIDEMLAAADRDGDGEVTWDEAMASPRFALGRAVADTGAQRLVAIKSSDINGDGLVDLPEARRFVALRHRAPSFQLQAAAAIYGRSDRYPVSSNQLQARIAQVADVASLLDRDGDAALSRQEIAAAAERLKSRDADDNDVLDAVEISGSYQVVMNSPAARESRAARGPALTGVLLGPAMNADALYSILSQRYMVATGAIKAESFPGMPQLFASLDEDGDGKLQKFEASRLDEVQPQIALAVDLGYFEQGRGLSVRSLAPDLAELHKSERHLSLALPGLLLTVTANPSASVSTDYERSAETMIARLDKDSNGYLDKSEVPAGIAAQLAIWDADGDGLVYAKEIAAAQLQTAAPRATQVVASVASHGSSLFQILDQNGDSRLGLRELRSAAERLALLDQDRDGIVTQLEIPALMSISFATGLSGGSIARVGPDLPRVDRPLADASPEWFQRMDRNGDGDLSLREFLGDRNDFHRLDANADGLISGQEAASR